MTPFLDMVEEAQEAAYLSRWWSSGMMIHSGNVPGGIIEPGQFIFVNGEGFLVTDTTVEQQRTDE